MRQEQLYGLVFLEGLFIQFERESGQIRQMGVEEHFLRFERSLSLSAEQQLVDLPVNGL